PLEPRLMSVVFVMVLMVIVVPVVMVIVVPVVVILVVIVALVVVVFLTVLVVVVVVVFLVSLVYLHRYDGVDHSVVESSSIHHSLRISCRQLQFIGSEMSNEIR